MASVATVVTMGYGTFGSVADVVRLGYEAAAVIVAPAEDTGSRRQLYLSHRDLPTGRLESRWKGM